MSELSSSVKFRKSRYVHGGETVAMASRIGWWSKKKISHSDDDIIITIDARYDKRPWNVAYDYYGSSDYKWVILQYNNILDINVEFVTGKVIRIPTPQRLGIEILSGSTGGVRPE